jgi:hypothetical protein
MALLISITLLLLIPVSLVQAAPTQNDEVTIGEDVVLREGERIAGELVVIGGNLTMQEDSLVTGNAAVVGGTATVDGTVLGDLVALGGDVTVGDQASVKGDVVALGGRVHRAEGADIGSVVQGPGLGTESFWRSLSFPAFTSDIGFRPGSMIASTVSTLFGAVFLALIGMAVYSFWPTQTAEVGRTIVTAPLPSLGVGCVVYPVAAMISFFILITICLAIFVPVVVLLVVAAGLFGWIALGVLLGRWLAQVTGWKTATPAVVAGVGVFVMSILGGILTEIPCLGSLVVFGAASIALGAVVLSRFGTRRYGAPATPSPGTPAPVPAVAPTIPEDGLDIAIREAVTAPADVEPTPKAEPSDEPATSTIPEDALDVAIREAISAPEDVEPVDKAEPVEQKDEPADKAPSPTEVDAPAEVEPSEATPPPAEPDDITEE